MRGLVVDSRGAPVPGARISLYALTDLAPLPTGPGGFAGEPSRALPTETSCADGSFRLGGLAEAEFRLRIAAGDRGVAIVEGAVALNESAAPIRVVLLPTRAVEGTVVDAAGVVLAGAAVTVGDEGEAEGRTDEHGRFRIGGVPGPSADAASAEPDRVRFVAASPDGKRFAIATLDVRKPVRIAVGGKNALTVTARGARSRRAIPGAQVIAFGGVVQGAITEAAWLRTTSLVRGTTDSDGMARLEGVDFALLTHWSVDAPGIGWTGGLLEQTGGLGDVAPQSLAVEADVERARSLVGRLTDEHGTSIAGAEILPMEVGRMEFRRATTDAEGRFQFRAVIRAAAARLGMTIWGWGRPPYLVEPDLGGWLAIRLAAPGFASPVAREGLELTGTADPIVLEVKLPRGARLEGRVVDPSGKLKADTQVSTAAEWDAWELGGGPSECRCAVRTDGTFTLVDVPPGEVRFLVTSREPTGVVRFHGLSHMPTPAPLVLAPGERRLLGDVSLSP